ncbi:Uncharacterised protein [Vibrio cholerae]|nr:Uncharacterised protein [Vibrio cholerae]
MTVPSIIIVPCEFFCRIGSAMIVTPSATTNRPVAPPQAFNFLCCSDSFWIVIPGNLAKSRRS